MEFEKILLNGKIYRVLSNKCPINIISKVTNSKTEHLKAVRLTVFKNYLLLFGSIFFMFVHLCLLLYLLY